ncbi:MAG: thiamine phosphate synthase [Alphaproteobacteria bacterium]|nr:thiamine phosphate synthase [Alphaproteobacteria bacterium]MBV9542458.1 thiamine phosphate synthase [Alphaproteobacteria bacterium]
MAGLLPPLVLMTDDERLPDPIAAARALPRGSMVVVRSRNAARRAEIAHRLPKNLIVLIANDPELAAACGADGLHLPETRAGEAAHWRARFPRWLITAATHTPRGANPHVDALFLSPIFPTASHPGAASLNAARANRIARASQTPLYALGGITPANARLLHGFVGIAAIGALSA